MRAVSRRGAARLVLVAAITWAMLGLIALAFRLRPCSSPVAFLSGCLIPVADDPNDVVIPKRTPNTIVKKLSYLTVDKQDNEQVPTWLCGDGGAGALVLLPA